MDKPKPFIADRKAHIAAERLLKNDFGYEEEDELKRMEALDFVEPHIDIPHVRSALAHFVGIPKMLSLDGKNTVINPMFDPVVTSKQLTSETSEYLISRINRINEQHNPSVNRALCLLAGIEYTPTT